MSANWQAGWTPHELRVLELVVGALRLAWNALPEESELRDPIRQTADELDAARRLGEPRLRPSALR